VKTDVWSFGVVMWEMYSFGEKPYMEFEDQREINDAIDRGYRFVLSSYSL
jgi:hypothetical protein